MGASHSMKLPTALSLLLSALLLVGTSASLPPCDFPAIFNFGDSNSDTGVLSAAFQAVPPPYGETFFGVPTGRYCDGRLIIDFIAERLGLPYLNAYLDSVGSNFSHGTNFASAAATIRRHSSIDLFSPFSLDVQYSQFSQFKPRSQRARKPGSVFKRLLPKKEYFSRALYTFDIGANDLTEFASKPTEEVLANISDVLSKFVIVIKAIYGEGGRYFWIHNTVPIGCLPIMLNNLPITASQLDRAGCSILFNKVARAFNKQLKEIVAQLRQDLPSAAFTYVDVYSVKYSLISQGRKYGFKHPLLSCCGYGGGKYNYNNTIRCGAVATVNGTRVVLARSCDHPSERIIWDGAHFTEAANKWVFDRISDGQFSDPPLPVRMACHRQAH